MILRLGHGSLVFCWMNFFMFSYSTGTSFIKFKDLGGLIKPLLMHLAKVWCKAGDNFSSVASRIIIQLFHTIKSAASI